jgi:ABC-type transport system substrate-binding protein
MLLLGLSAAAPAQTAFKETPSVAPQIASGALPARANRLPAQPLVERPLEEVGKYGGQWRQAMRGSADILLETTNGCTRLVRWNHEWTDVEPELAEKVEVNANAAEYVFALRAGLRRSDGQPFTADDIRFRFDSVLMDKDITPSVPRWLTSGGKAVKVTKRDARKVVICFEGPNGMFLKNMVTSLGADILADGARLGFAVDAPTTSQIRIDALEVVKKPWRAVGVEMQVRPVERSLAFQRLQSNNHDANVWVGGGYDQLGLPDPKWCFPHEFGSSYATAWGIHFQNPNSPVAEEPSPAAKKQRQLFVQLQQKPTTAEQPAVMKEILAITGDELHIIGTNLEPDRFGIVKANMRNVPARSPSESAR